MEPACYQSCGGRGFTAAAGRGRPGDRLGERASDCDPCRWGRRDPRFWFAMRRILALIAAFLGRISGLGRPAYVLVAIQELRLRGSDGQAVLGRAACPSRSDRAGCEERVLRQNRLRTRPGTL